MAAPKVSKYVTLVAADGFEFVVLREAAMVSPVIRGMLDVRSELNIGFVAVPRGTKEGSFGTPGSRQ